MENYELALIVIFSATGLGLIGSVVTSEPADAGQQSVQQTHEHALFHVVINGSEKDFTDPRFQLNSRTVHLENNNSDIVHKHVTGVTWSGFLRTINTSYWESNSTGNFCLQIYERIDCGDGGLYLNGDKVENLDEEIFQGDSLLIILNTSNRTEVIDKYSKQQLPPEYKPSSVRGNRV